MESARWRRETNDDNERSVSRRANVAEKPRVVVRPPSGFQSRPASRLASANIDRSLGLSSRRERLVSQQGLSGTRAGTARPQTRQYQDKRYFSNLLQVKMGKIQSEIKNLLKQLEIYTRDQASYLIYDNRVKEIAAQLTDSQRLLMDYNVAIDKKNIGHDIKEINADCEELLAQNDSDMAALEALFLERKRRQSTCRKLEDQINHQKLKYQEIIEAMDPPMRSYHDELQEKISNFAQQLDKLNGQSDSLNLNRTALWEKISHVPMKVEKFKIEKKLLDLESKKLTLLRLPEEVLSTQDERENLLLSVKENKNQIVNMERAIADISEKIAEAREMIAQREHVDMNSTVFADNSDILKKGDILDDFLSNSNFIKKEEITKYEVLNKEILHELYQYAATVKLLPSEEDYRMIEMNEPLPEGEDTTPLGRYKHLSSQLQKVEAVGKKIDEDLSLIMRKMNRISKELVTYSDTKIVQGKAETRKNQLLEERKAILNEKQRTAGDLRNVTNTFNSLQNQLVENEVHAQLTFSELKLANIEQSNASINEFIKAHDRKDDLGLYRQKVLDQVRRINLALRQQLLK